ncbi:MAG: glycoside-pentoside-hexuronide (GPH):cation symporter [Dermatophilaceae bacterium]
MSTATVLQGDQGALAKVKPTSLLGYGLGDFGCNLAFALSTTFLLFYYTDVAGLSAAAVGTMFLVVRLWDAFADLIAGRAVDSTMTRWGKFRPFILFGAVPLLFLSYLTFNVPTQWRGDPTAPLASGPGILYAYLSYAVLGLLYSMVNIPYGSLASAMSQSVHQRAKLVAARAFGSATSGVFLTYIIAPKIADLQKKSGPLLDNLRKDPTNPALRAQSQQLQSDLQSVFTQTTLLFIVLGTASFLMTFLWCREGVVRTAPKTTIKQTFATLKHNKPLAILCGASFFYLTGVNAVGPATAYYARYILGDTALTAPITLVNSGIALLITPLIPAIINRVGKKTLFQYCGLFTIAGGVALFFSPAGAVAIALVFLAVKGVGASLINTTMFGLEADTVEYGEWKSGQRTEGATYAIFSFTRKVTQSLGGAAGAWLLAWGGYVGGASVQPESALTAIRAAIGLVPALCALVAMIVFIRYPLNDNLFRKIRNEVETRKRAQLVGSDPAS